MKKLILALRVAFALAFIAALAVGPIVARYESKAQLVQLVRPSEGASLFGDVGENIGSPQMLVIDVPREAVLEGEGPQGSILVSSVYLKDHGIYPRQLQTIVDLAGYVRTTAWIATGGVLVALLALRWRGRFGKAAAMT